MSRTLLIWQMVPEDIEWFVLDSPSDDELAILAAAHGNFLNTDSTEDAEAALDKVNAYIADPAKGYDDEFLDSVGDGFGKWLHKKVSESALPDIGPIDKVFTCGFIL